jgi:hypothetical protein
MKVENQAYLHSSQHLTEIKNESRKPDKNWSLRRLEYMPRNLEQKTPFRNSISEQDPMNHIWVFIALTFIKGRTMTFMLAEWNTDLCA